MEKSGRQAVSGTELHYGALLASGLSCGEPSSGGPLQGGWAGTGREEQRAAGRRTLTGHTDWVYAVASAVVEGQPVAVTGSHDLTVRVWDLVTGQPVGHPLTAHTHVVFAVATTVVDDRPVAVSGSHDGRVRVWDLATGQPVGHPLIDHIIHVMKGVEIVQPVTAVAATVLDGRPVAVTGSADGRVRVWDLATGQSVGHSLTAHTHMVFAVATTVLDGRPVAVTGSVDKTVRIWDLGTGRQIAAFPQIRRVRAVVATEVGGQAMILAAAGRWVRLMDPVTGKRIGPLMAGHTREITALTTLMRHGETIAVTGSDDHTVRAWDLASGRQIGPALPFPNPITALAAAPDGGLLVCHGTEVTFLAAGDGLDGERSAPLSATGGA